MREATSVAKNAPLRVSERYVIYDAIAAGATATVHVGRLTSARGFGKTVAIKRLHPHLAKSDAFRTILVEEARLAARVSHPNVVQVLDVVDADGEVLLVLEYVHGETLERLLAQTRRPPVAVCAAIAQGVLRGLHAAHAARGTDGAPLDLVHRDITPRNVIVTTDGVAKILDFGIAKARGRDSTTGDGRVRGTLPYMPPEQLHGDPLTARSDLYACAVVLWEALAGERLFTGETESGIAKKILDHDVRAPTTVHPDLPPALDAVVLRGLARDPAQRYASGLEMALAIEQAVTPATPAEVAAWVKDTAKDALAARDALLAHVDVEANAAPIAPTAAAIATPHVDPPRRAHLASVLGAIAVAALAVTVTLSIVRAAVATSSPGSLSAARPEPGVPPTPTSTATTTASPGSLSASRPEPGVPANANTNANATATADDPIASASVGSLARAPASRSAPRVHAPAVAPSPPPAVPSAAPSCSPYYVDDAGHRRFDRQCLK